MGGRVGVRAGAEAPEAHFETNSQAMLEPLENGPENRNCHSDTRKQGRNASYTRDQPEKGFGHVARIGQMMRLVEGGSASCETLRK
jgi:hypothetical protein